MIERVTKKVIQSGDIIEIYEYSEGYLKGYKLTENEVKNRRRRSNESGSDDGSDDTDRIDSRERSLKRAKANLRRLINSNVGQYGKEFTAKFLTLTFKDNVQDIKQANYEFMKFIKRLNYHCFGTKKAKLKYTCVIEFQKRGAIHYHVIIYNMPFVKANDIAEIWGNGYIKINRIEDVDNVGAYVAEYLKGQGKSTEDDRLRGQKSYFSSHGLIKPREITDKEIVEQVATVLLSQSQKLVYSVTYENEHVGKVVYKQYNLKLNNSIG